MQEESQFQKSPQTESRLIRDLPKGLIQWYPFSKGAKALFLSGGEEVCEVLPEAMEECGLLADCIPLSVLQHASPSLKTSAYDYIILAGAIERTPSPQAFLSSLRPLLTPKGRLLIGAHNRLAIRYFCGDRDPFSHRNFDGIENYIRLSALDWKRSKGRAYSKAELTEYLENAGFPHHRFYAAFPEWTCPQALYAEGCVPKGKPWEGLIPQYDSPDTIFLEEERLYPALIQNQLFHAMSNGFFIECPLDGTFADACQVMVSTEYGRKEAMATIFHSNYRKGQEFFTGQAERKLSCHESKVQLKDQENQVEKIPLYPEGREKPNRLMENMLAIKRRGLHTLPCSIKDGSIFMPQIKYQTATDYFRTLIRTDKERFLHELDRFWETVKASSDPVPDEEVDWEHFDPDWKKGRADDPGRDKWRKLAFGSREDRENLGVILREGYINLDSQNCFYINGEFVFYNQFYCQEHFPANAILIRTIDAVFGGDVWKDGLMKKDELLERYHLLEHEKLWHLYSWRFTDKLRNEKELREFYRQRRRDWQIVNANRYRMNYSDVEYERVFKDIFKGTEGRQLYLFGSGIYAKKFLEDFGADYPVAGVLDNNRDRWGDKLLGIPILSPECLCSMAEDSCKVLICIKDCVPVMRQLDGLGIHHYSVYDCHQEYPRKLPKAAAAVKEEGKEPKKYHVGYVAGVFDLFHVGHLNMFKRAKEQCDYLIVGVVTDESVMNNKKTMPCMSFEERIALVRSCRYVDEAVELPTYNGDTDEAYRRYHFDVQFSGSDYADDPVWLAKKEYLEKRGAAMVFFPYTQTTSSSKLKEMIGKRLL